MTYTNAIFYIDYDLGSDAARTNIVPSAYADNGLGAVRVTVGSLGVPAIVTGAVVTIASTTSAVYNGAWIVTVIDATNIDLVGSVFTVNPAAKGTCVPFGGDSWTNAWKTLTTGATAARIAPGDTVRIAKSPDPISIGNGTWTSNPNDGGVLPTATNITAMANNGAGLIRVTSAAHGLVTGNVVQILAVTGTVEANGNWIVTYVASNQFDLVGSTYVNAWVSGGTAQNITSRSVILATAQTLTIDQCETIWTVANASTITLTAYTTDAKKGQNCIKIAKSSPADSTLYAYSRMTATDCSGYQKISFWIKNSTAILANQWNLCLCSDIAGATVIDTFAIPAIPSTAQWLPLTIARNGGGNLGDSIQSVALYSGTSEATTAGIFLDNVIACTTSGLNLQSLISKNTLAQSTINDAGYANEGWYGIKSIRDEIVVLDNATNAISNVGMGYYSSIAQETVTTYIRETIKTALAATTTAIVQSFTDSGTVGDNISFLGGYDTATNIQDGETFFDGLNGFGYGLNGVTKSYLTIDHLSVIRYYYGHIYQTTCNYITINTISDANNCTLNGVYIAACTNMVLNTLINANNNQSLYTVNTYYAGITASVTSGNTTVGTIVNANNNMWGGVIPTRDNGSSIITTIINACNNNYSGICVYNNGRASSIGTIVNASYNNLSIYIYLSANVTITTITNTNFGSYGYYSSSSTRIVVGTISNANNNINRGIQFNACSDCTIENATAKNNAYGVAFAATAKNNVISTLHTSGNTSYGVYIYYGGEGQIRDAYIEEANGVLCANYFDCRLHLKDRGDGNYYIYTDGGWINSTTVTRHTPSGLAWQMYISTNTRTLALDYPLSFKLADVAVNANKLVTFSVWVKLDSDTNIGAQLAVPTGYTLTVEPAHVQTVATTDWQLLTITFTPTIQGVQPIYIEGYWVAAAGNIYIDDITVNQAV